MNAAEIIRRAETEGGMLAVEGGNIRLVSDEPLPADVVALLRDHKADVMAAIRAEPPHRRAIRGSITRPDDFAALTGETLDWWKAVVYGATMNGKSREEAERVAWEDVALIHEEAGQIAGLGC